MSGGGGDQNQNEAVWSGGIQSTVGMSQEQLGDYNQSQAAQARAASIAQQAAAAAQQQQATEAAFTESTGLPYVNPGDKQYASKTQANIARAQWEDYKTRFQPYEDQLAGMLSTDSSTNDMIARAEKSLDTTFATAKTNLGMKQSKYRMTPDATESASMARGMGLDKAATQVGNRNAIRTAAYDRDLEIMTGAGSAAGGLKVAEGAG